jgi:hypothetical protein
MQAVISSPTKEEARREKIQAGWEVDKPRQTGKANKGKTYNVRRDIDGTKEFSPDHHTHLSEAAARRHRRARAMQQSEAQQDQL